VIESPFATVRLRERATKGASSRTKGLIDGLQAARYGHLCWWRLDGAGLLPLVLAGVKFVDGVQKKEGGNRYSTPSDNARREAT
jgi:hypothetical protein